jgi:hypothetical protein
MAARRRIRPDPHIVRAVCNRAISTYIGLDGEDELANILEKYVHHVRGNGDVGSGNKSLMIRLGRLIATMYETHKMKAVANLLLVYAVLRNRFGNGKWASIDTYVGIPQTMRMSWCFYEMPEDVYDFDDVPEIVQTALEKYVHRQDGRGEVFIKNKDINAILKSIRNREPVVIPSDGSLHHPYIID